MQSPNNITTMFEQLSVSVSPTQYHWQPTVSSPILPKSSNLQQYIILRRLIKVLPILLPYIPTRDLHQLQLVCRSIDPYIQRYVWKRPSFHNDSMHDALTLFQRFLQRLPDMRPSTRQAIRELYLTPMEESLYERVPKDFFRTLVQYTNNLSHLNMSRATFFSSASLPPNHWQWQQLTSLDLSYVEHLTDPLLVKLATSLPQLRLVRLDGTRVNHGVSQLAYHCDHLSSLSLKHTSLTDEALTGIAKFRTIHITELDISACRHLSSASLDILARYCIHLTWLGLAYTSISLETLRRLDHRYWKYLDIAHCHWLHQHMTTSSSSLASNEKEITSYRHDILAPSSSSPTSFPSPRSLYDLIISAPQLQHLSVSMPVVQHLLSVRHDLQQKEKLVDVNNASSSHVRYLVLHDLPEQTPISFLDDLQLLFPKARHIKLVRGYYESDSLLGSYSSDIQDAFNHTVITEESIKDYCSKARQSSPFSVVSIVLEQHRELLEGQSMW
ncbi:uncharacterized protein BX664DRAFT_320488 [Halteromyces radiatus]|uniref:uncharacterized protein n=1 Tax=Halteromyces radiatus TaxID=101107 RepID=UPI00221EC03A|nr:uncharacterized protein BX664DRAFT_320488 [Halteromyces radiatus]KAI8099136.1 hypothetical protein BX664DRAFT_320488 [Halteromyces radiatus]